MRKRFEQQQQLGITPIAEVKFPKRSRHELPPILMGLQYIFCEPELNAQVFDLLETRIYEASPGKQTTGRPGMNLWEILVFGVVRLGTDSDWDALLHMANFDQLLRGILGVRGTGFGSEEKEYRRQTLVDNVSLLDEQTIMKINLLVVEHGHRIVKKKEDQGLEVKADTYVLESNIHYPTDTRLLLDSARKCIDLMESIPSKYRVQGWRKAQHWLRRLKSSERAISQAFRKRGLGREDLIQKAATNYLQIAHRLALKVGKELPRLQEQFKKDPPHPKHQQILYYYEMLAKFIDQVWRRLVKRETIPQAEKVFSIFQPCVEWISKGKEGKRVEFGHKVLVATDQYGWIIHHKVIQNTDDRDLAIPLATQLCNSHQINSLSLDRGFYSAANKRELKKLIPTVTLPKKGKRSQAEYQEEKSKQFRVMRNRHNAVESNINQLEHNGLNQCPDVGLTAFKRYTAFGVLAYNLHRLGKLILQRESKRQKTQQSISKAA